jgi:threonine dehydrogenase-like Zn-dependent dehydrogenase
MIALEFSRSVPRYIASRVAGRAAPALASRLAPLRLGHLDDPSLPGDGWVRVAPRLSGICGSDLAMLSGDASFYFSPIVSMPFVPGHEVVGTLDDGTRVVIEPVLACAARGIDPPCGACARGDIGLCTRTAHGHLSPGLQTGFCENTGGGWGTMLVAHSSQIHPIPEDLSDEAAVLIEPLACAVHAVLRANVIPNSTVLVSGAGTMGLLTIAALRELTGAERIVAVAKHPRQRSEARRLGADDVVTPDTAVRSLRLLTGALLHEPEQGRPWLAGGVDVSFECSGNSGALDTCLRVTRGRGTVVLVGLPAAARIDLAPIWHRELSVVGAYTYGVETEGRGAERATRRDLRSAGGSGGAAPPTKGRRTFDIAIDLAQRVDLSPLVSAAYPLTRYEEAIDHAMDAGRLGAVKVVFELGKK